jgi:cytidine deaminase
MTSQVTTEERSRLIQAALNAAETAYAPYSKFRVGAAALGEQMIHIGSNVENSSYTVGLCAERAALSAAVAQRDGEIRALAVACIDALDSSGINELLPCGACRQWFVELAPDAEIIIVGNDNTKSFTVEELMPLPFRLEKKVSENQN